MNKKLLLLTVLLSASGGVMTRAATMESITNALQKYCVPKPNSYFDGTLVCGSEFEGVYTKGKACSCHDNNNLKWDAAKRHCVVKCNGGAFPRLLDPKETKGKKCPPGYGYDSTKEIKRQQ